MRKFTSLAKTNLSTAFKLLSVALAVVLFVTNVNAQLSSVPVTGFNADEVANGIGVPTGSTTVSADLGVDNGNFVFIDGTYKYDAACAAATMNILPATNQISSVAASGLVYNLQSYSGNNALRIPAVGVVAGSGTLTLVTPTKMASLYLLVIAGGGAIASGITVTVNFTDLSSQTLGTNMSASDWCSGATSGSTTLIPGQYFRIQALTATCGTQSTCQYLYEMSLPLSGSNFNKFVSSITIAKTTTTNVFNIFGVGMKAPCTAPSAQPTLLTQGITTTSSIAGSFTAAAGSPAGYLVVRYPSGSTPTAPADGTTYVTGNTIGTGTVVSAGATTTFTASALAAATTYDFYIYSYASAATCGGPIYLATTPLIASFTTSTCSGLAGGTYTVGPTGTYLSLGAALTAVGSGITGPVILELQSNYTDAGETFPIVLPVNPCIGAANSLTIRPAAGATGLTITNTAASATFDFNGAQYVTIDGRPGGVGSTISVPNTSNLSIINTNAAVNGVAILMRNDASNNTVKYCDLQGKNATSTANTQCGVVYVGGTTGTTGNDNNTFDRCNMHAVSGSTLGIGFYSSGSTTTTVTYNDNNTVSNCNIYDYFVANLATTGLKLENGCNAWTVTNNHFFQQNSLAYTASVVNRGIWITPTLANGNGFIITGNYIGGINPAGTGVYTMTSTSTTAFWGMDISVGAGTATSVQNNTITNISFTSTNTTTNPLVVGISTAAGNIDVGTVTGNIIGGASGTGLINAVSTGSGSTTWGIRIGGGNTINIQNNIVGGITASSSAVGNSANLNGIGNGGGSVVNIIGNTIVNLVDGIPTQTANGGQLVGINLSTALTSPVTNNNIIHDLLSNAPNLNTNTSSGVIGIMINSTSTTGATITGNQMYNLSNINATTSAAYAPYIFGILLNSSITGTSIISKNIVHSFDLPNWSPSGTPTGVPQYCGIAINSGAANIYNNVVRLGINGSGTDVTGSIRFIGINKANGQNNNIWHNSVYIGGSNVVTTAVVGTTIYSAAFQRATTGVDEIRDNIFVNVRSNASATSTAPHFAVRMNATTTATIDYNVYQSGGINNLFGFNGASNVSTYSSGWITGDTHSWPLDPKFINPTGNAATVDLHIQASPSVTPVESNGTLVALVTDDIDGQTRSGLTPVDIGADAGNFTALSPCIVPNAPTALNLSAAGTTQINGSFTAATGTFDGYLVVRYATGATPTAPVVGTNYNVGNTLGTGTVIAIGNSTSFNSTGLFPATAYDFYIYSYNSVCTGGTKYSTALLGTQSTTPCGGPAGIITVGPTGSFLTLNDAFTSMASTGISSAVTIELQSAYTGETAPITINSNVCFTPTNTVTIRPATGANGLVITGNNVGPTIDFAGANYVTIDGTPGGTTGSPAMAVTAAGSNNATNLNIINTNAGGVAIRMDNQASNNKIKYCDLQGQNTTSGSLPAGMAGVVYFGNIAGTNGNDNNTVDHCNIHSTSASAFPTIAVYSMGVSKGTPTITADFNDNCTISNNNIYDFFSATLNTGGVELNFGNNAWTISNNSFFQTATRTTTTGGIVHRMLWVNPNASTNAGNGFVVTNNYFGGSAPLCGGVACTYTGTVAYTVEAMKFEVVDGTIAVPTSIQNNTVANLSVTANQTGDPIHVLWASGTGNLNIGTVTGNTIGTATGSGGAATGGITLTGGTSSNNHMIIIPNSAAGTIPIVNIKNNKINNILLTSAGANFSAIFVKDYGTFTIDNNTIGNTTDANGIQSSSTSTTSTFIYGINAPSSASGTLANNLNVTITNNTIANLTNNTTGTGTTATTVGIAIAQSSGASTISVPTISGNTIFNLRSDALNTNTGGSSAIFGICMNSTSALATNITNNKIYNLISTAPTANIAMEGIYINGNATVANMVTRNLVHSFDAVTTGTGATMAGIDVNAGTVTVANNMVRLGIKADATDLTGTISIRGIKKGTTNNTNVYFNSVYVGGNNVGTVANNTYAFLKSSSGTADDIRSNIFANVRSNATTGGKHYAVSINNITGLTLNNNIYRYDGTGGVFALNGAADVASYSTGWIAVDANSYAGDPSFINPSGSAASLDLHLSGTTPAESGGANNITAITTDYDNDVRQGSAGYAGTGTAPDIGADEFDGASPTPSVSNLIITPSTTQCVATSRSISVDVAPVSPSAPIASVTLNYSLNGVAQAPIAMTGGIPFIASTWQGTIPAAVPTNATVTWSVTASDGTYLKSVIGTPYMDDPLAGVTATATASVNPVCAGSPTSLSVSLFGSAPPAVPAVSTYCQSTHTSGCSGDNITSVVLNTLNSTASACGLTASTPPRYLYVTTATTTLAQGTPFNLTLSFGADGNQYFGAWIDYNHDGNYDATEFLGASGNAGSNGTISITFTVPSSAYNGLTHMRIIGGNDAALTSGQACGASSSPWGETQDFDITITGAASLAPYSGPIDSYSWSNGATVVGTTNPLVVSPSTTTTYTCTATVSGCSVSASTSPVNIATLPGAPTATNSSQCGPGVPTAFVASNAGAAGSGYYNWYDAATAGNLVQQGSLINYYTNNFSSATLSNASISGNASIGGGIVTLTPDLTSQQGGLTVNPSGVNSDFYKVDFDLILTSSASPMADGFSYSFADDALATTATPTAEHGSGSKLKIGFFTYNTPSGSDGRGIYLMYNCTALTGYTAATTGVLVYSTNASWIPAFTTLTSHCTVNINSTGQLTLTVGGVTIFNTVQLPAAFTSSNKSTWKHVFSARSGGVQGGFAMDNLVIQTGLGTPGYTTYQNSINNTTTFYVSELGTNGCETNRTSITATVNPITALAPNGSNGTFTQNGTGTTNYADNLCRLIGTITTVATNLGSVTATNTIDAGVLQFNTVPYIQRHAVITPTTNGAATVTLYCTQQECTAYNSFITSNSLTQPLLPSTGSNSDPNKNNFKITKFTTSTPTGTGTLLIPTAINWNSTNNWWEITVNVPSFSGFFIHSGNAPLAIRLLSFKGANYGSRNRLDWETAEESKSDRFVLQRSIDGVHYSDLSTTNANGKSSTYTYWDNAPVRGIDNYRLKTIEASGAISYSNTVSLEVTDKGSFTVEAYPNPVKDIATVKVYGEQGNNASLLLTDVAGRVIRKASVNNNEATMDMHDLAPGIYLLKYADDSHSQTFKMNKE